MKYIDEKHKEFVTEKNKKLIETGKNDVYHKSLVYILGISEETRKKFNKIYDEDSDTVNQECIDEPWQTGSSKKICRMAFSLWNGTVNLAADKEYFYSPDELFSCSYSPYFWQGIKIRYPEYCVESLEQVEVLPRIGRYIRVQSTESNKENINSSLNFQKKQLDKFCMENNIEDYMDYVYIPNSKQTFAENGLSKILKDVKNGEIDLIIINDINLFTKNKAEVFQLIEELAENDIQVIFANAPNKSIKDLYLEMARDNIFESVSSNMKKIEDNIEKEY